MFFCLALWLSGCGKNTPLKNFLEIGGSSSARIDSPEVAFHTRNAVVIFTLDGEVKSGLGDSVTFTFKGIPDLGRSYSLPSTAGTVQRLETSKMFDSGKFHVRLRATPRDASDGEIASATVQFSGYSDKVGGVVSFEFAIELNDGQTYKGTVVTTVQEALPSTLL